MDKLTLDSAREQIAAQATEIQGLQTRITEFEANSQSKDLELTQIRTDLTAIQAEKTAWEAEKAGMVTAAAETATVLTAAQAQVAELQKKDMNADMRAAERLASISGKPLQIAGNNEPNLSLVDISLKADEANAKGDKAEANRLWALYEKTRTGKS